MTSKHNDPGWREAGGHMVAANDAASKLSVIVAYVQDIHKQGLAVNLVTDEIADTARDLADEMINALRNAVAAKRNR